MNWYQKNSQDILKELSVDPTMGLSETEVKARREKYGTNEITSAEKRSPVMMFVDQFRELMVIILIIAAVVSFLLHEQVDAIIIFAIVILNAILGFVQEFRAEQAMAALQQMAAPNVNVRRGGSIRTVPSADLVPGDVVLVDAGDAIPADGRLIVAANLRIEEASLTGESVPISKQTDTIETENAPLGDRKNMVYMGTSVNYGRGEAIIVNTGMNTELGTIASLIQNVENEQTPLQKRMTKLGKTLALFILGIILLVVALGLWRAEEINSEVVTELFITAVAMAVAAIPEGLPAIVTIALALGARRMLDRKSLIRKLPAVETLGSVTTICSDKTGTLTQNRMTVQILDLADERVVIHGKRDLDSDNNASRFEVVEGTKDVQSIELALMASALCNDARIQPNPDNPSEMQTIGDPTEAALVVAADAYNLQKDTLDKWFPRVDEIPFSSDRKRMTTIHRMTDEALGRVDLDLVPLLKDLDHDYVAFVKGGLGIVLDRCTHHWVHDHVEPLTDEIRAKISESHDKLATQGLRVLGVALRGFTEQPESTDFDAIEQNLIFTAIIGMIDPPRPEVAMAVKDCLTAGIRPVMITGDHPITAKEIAKQLNIAEAGATVVTGPELEVMSDSDLENIVEKISVFARVSPEHKLRIVQALQNKGHIVAMTGDGVNDAPALRKSNIGVAMGITGTDVSKEAAEMVILDDNFATIVSAVKEGRTIYDNIRKFLQYILTSNAGEIYVMLFAPFLGMPLPLIARQILWINLVTDGLPGLALSVEPSEKDTMQRKPYEPDESIFSRGIGSRVLWAGLLMGVISLGVGYAGFKGWIFGHKANDLDWWRTMVFNTLTLSQMGNALAIRSNRESIFTLGLRSNMLLVYAVITTFLLQLAVIYVPFMQRLFDTVALSLPELLLSLGLSTLVFWAIEAEKWFKRRKSA